MTKQFVRLYYGILNTHPEQLFQFYGENSTVIVSAFGTGAPATFTDTAESREARTERKGFGSVNVRLEYSAPFEEGLHRLHLQD